MMQEAFKLLAELTQADIAWLQEQGTEQQVMAGTLIIREGDNPTALFIVLEGMVGIEIAAVSDQPLAQLGPGELLGEISFIEQQPASATIKAVENSRLLVLAQPTLEAKLAQDTAFAARFYRACARIASRRLRERVNTLAQGLQERPLPIASLTTTSTKEPKQDADGA